MNSIFDMVYISVESRKGGVGKTTTAISLSETLLDEGYQVLMVDMDIVGTTIDSTFINANKGLIHEVKLKGQAVNLIQLFKNVYMAGKNVPAFALEAEKKNTALSFELGKCNFIGSNIYDKPNGTTTLEDPRILYDAFHAYWLLEFVNAISQSFKIAIGTEAKVAVILDNSPGFSSIENSIHDYLTDLGPEKGKVLLVSTIDPQDIRACRQSKMHYEERFNDKVAAGDYFRSMSAGVIREKRNTSSFESVWNSLCASGGQQPEYHSKTHEKVPPYVSILVNKVPVLIFEQLFAKGILRRDSEIAAPFQNHLLYYYSNPQLSANEITHQQVYTDRYYQYMQSGRIENIEVDDARYLDFCKFSNRIGLGDFFRQEWSPLTHFRDLLDIMRERGSIKEESKFIIKVREIDSVDKENKLNLEVDAVSRFVLANTPKDSELKMILPDVVEFVESVLSNMEGKNDMDFHPDHPKLFEIGDFVSSFGLAVYRLHIYKQVCEILNMLIVYCLKNIENFEKLDKDTISNWIDNVLEGRVVERDLMGALEQKLDNRRNARALANALQVIIRSWEL